VVSKFSEIPFAKNAVKEVKPLDEQNFLESILKASALEPEPIGISSTSSTEITNQKNPTVKKLASPTKDRSKDESGEVSAKIARLLEQASAVQKRANRSNTSAIASRPDATQNEKLSSFFDSLLKK
jgi:hypothetical protein